MRILIATDSFPPGCGGSGWSTYELAAALRRRGHDLLVLQPRPGRRPGVTTRTHDGFTILEPGAVAPDLPFVRNWFKGERLWPRLERLMADLIRRERIDVVHAQHVLTGVPAVAAGRRAGVPAVCTVRDYWPICYWSDLIHDPAADHLCPGCSRQAMSICIRPRAGAAWPLVLPMVFYMRGNLARKRSGLAAADAVVAVSTTIAADLRARAPELARTRIEIIPSPVDAAAIRREANQPAPLAGSYALYVGKLAPNKGVRHLLPVIERAQLTWPVVIVGDGPERPGLEAAARRSGRPIRFTGWLPREDALRWLGHAALLIFPSHGPESLSRVLLEAGALGVPAAAMDTGGTRDIITHDINGLLSTGAEGLAADVARLAGDAALRQRLGAAARAHVDERFGADVVAARIEALYLDLAGTR
jgi:glycogen synthase